MKTGTGFGWRVAFVAIASCAVFAAGCSKAAWIKEDEEEDLVDAHRGGIVVYDQLVAEVTTKLLENHGATVRAQGPMLVAFVGIENEGAEELRDIRGAVYENVDTILVNSQKYRPLSRTYIDTAMRSSGLRAEDLFLKHGRERFLAAVRAEGLAPDYLLFAKVTTLSSTGVDERQRNYQLTLEMVDAASGEIVAKETGRVRKGFND
jgi:hypothetical protein